MIATEFELTRSWTRRSPQLMTRNLEVMIDSGLGLNENHSRSGLTGADKIRSLYQIELWLDVTAAKVLIAVNVQCYQMCAAPLGSLLAIIPVLTAATQKLGVKPSAIVNFLLAQLEAFGLVIANNASISGAEGGCKAVGSASASRRGCINTSCWGTPYQAGSSGLFVIKNIAWAHLWSSSPGLVEVPCVSKRNGSQLCLHCCWISALAGIESKIPDWWSYWRHVPEVGSSLPTAFRETAEKEDWRPAPTGRGYKEYLVCKPYFWLRRNISWQFQSAKLSAIRTLKVPQPDLKTIEVLWDHL